MTVRQQRALRGAIAASTATLLAAASHTTAGGSAPTPLLVALMITLLTPVAGALLGTRPHLPRLAATVTLSQVAFHGAFALLGSPTGGRISAAGPGGHAHEAVLPAVQTAAPESAVMYIGHVAAAIITVVLLWRGERVVRAIARGAVGLLRRAASPRIPIVAALPRIAPTAPLIRALGVLLSSASRRGPPTPHGA